MRDRWRTRWRHNRLSPTKTELQRFVELARPEAPEGQLTLLLLYAFLHCPHPREKILERARRWDLSPGQTELLIRGEVDTTFPWYSLEGMLTDCRNNAAYIELARELFNRAAASATSRPAPSPAAADEQFFMTGQVAGVPKPDPMKAASAAEFVQLMVIYRAWTGRRSYRKMSLAIGGRYVPSTLSGIANRATLPSLDLVTAYIEGCGADPGDIEMWRQAWRHLTLTQE